MRRNAGKCFLMSEEVFTSERAYFKNEKAWEKCAAFNRMLIGDEVVTKIRMCLESMLSPLDKGYSLDGFQAEVYSLVFACT